MAIVSLDTSDYVTDSLDAVFAENVTQAVCQRLRVHRARYWANPDYGSRFNLLQQEKDVPRLLLICKQYAEEALKDMVPARLQSIVVTATRTVTSRIDLTIATTRLTGQQQNILYFVKVGG